MISIKNKALKRGLGLLLLGSLSSCATITMPDGSVEESIEQERKDIVEMRNKDVGVVYKPLPNKKSALKSVVVPREAAFLQYPTALVYRNSPAREAIQNLVYGYPVRFDLFENTDPIVSSRVNAVTLKDHLDAIMVQADWHYDFVDGVFIVTDIQTERFNLIVPPGKRGYDVNVDSLARDSGGANSLVGGEDPHALLQDAMESIGFISDDASQGQLASGFRAGKMAKFSIMTFPNIMVVTASPNLVRKAKELVSWFNSGHSTKAEIEVALYELEFSRGSDRSLDLNLLSSAALDSVLNISGPAISSASVGAAGLTLVLNDEADRLNGSSSVLNWLKSHGATSRVMSFRRELSNNELATVESRQANPYVEKVAQTNVSTGASTSQVPDVILSNRDTGYSMHILPTINADTDEVSLRINYSIAAVNGSLDYSFDEGRVSGQAPKTLNKNEVISVGLRDGEAKIISSALISDKSSLKGKTPLLPILGDSQSTSEDTKEYVLYISAVIKD
jgi:hypothetical protein